MIKTVYDDMVVRKDFAEKSRLLEFDISRPIDVKYLVRLVVSSFFDILFCDFLPSFIN
jgi:hypothetical protein